MMMMMSEEDLYSDYLDDSWTDKTPLLPSGSLSLSPGRDYYIGSKLLNSSKRSIYENQNLAGGGAIRGFEIDLTIIKTHHLQNNMKLRQLPEGTYRN